MALWALFRTLLASLAQALVTSRVWTESVHIEQRLADLTEHMEKVIQKFLRNQFQTFQEYNEQAGSVGGRLGGYDGSRERHR